MKTNGLLFLFLISICNAPAYADPIDSSQLSGWINKNLEPVKYLTAGNGFADLEHLDKRIGNARIVALGECTHGSSEIFTMKHRLLEYLVKKKGFTVFSIEANMPEAYALNKYILKGEGDLKKLIEGMYFWTWYTWEVYDMVVWMKKYNDTSVKELMFTGFDMQFPSIPINIVREYATIHLPSVLPVINKYDTLYLKNSTVLKPSGSYANDLKKYALAILNGLGKLDKAKSDSAQWVLQNARILLQYAELKAPLKKRSFAGDRRDEAMAENVDWILNQNPGAKMVIWAHNGHIRKAEKFGIPMGWHLDKKFGPEMITIGFSTEEGTYTAVKKIPNGALLRAGNQLLPSKYFDIEYYFKDAKAENFIVDFRDAISDPANTWITQPFGLRHLGAGVNDKFQFISTQLNKDFDMMIFIKKTTSSKCFRVL